MWLVDILYLQTRRVKDETTRRPIGAAGTSGGRIVRWLTAIVGYVNQGRYWTLAGFAGGRTLVIGQVALKESKLLDRRDAYLISQLQPY